MDEHLAGYRLSPQQRDLWRVQSGAQAGEYRAQCTVAIEGDLDAAALSAAVDRLVREHEILRTTFRNLPGTTLPVQVIADEARAEIEHVDHGGVAAGERKARIDALTERARRRALDVAGGPALRLEMARLAPRSHVLVLTLPALCADALGAINTVRALARAYADALGESAPGAEPSEPMQYADLAEWQNELLEDGAAQQRFSAPAADADLSFVEAGAVQQLFDPRSAEVPLDAALAARVRAAAAELGVGEDVFVLACWQLLLMRCAGADVLTVGVACDGRGYEGLGEALGLFAKDLPLTSELDRAQPFAALVAQTAQRLAELHERQEQFCQDRLANGTANGAGPARLPVCFGYLDATEAAFAAGGVSFRVERAYACTHRFALKLAAVRGAPAGEGLRAELHYDTARLDAAGVERLARRFAAVLASAAADPQAPAGRLQLLDAAERRAVLHELNAAVPAEPVPARGMHELIAERVRAAPDAVAVVCGAERLTYGELGARTGALAAQLRAMGVRPGVLVGLCAERSAAMIVGIAAILEAGGAYVPMDPSYPAQRLAFMLQDAQAPVVLVQGHLRAALGESGARLVDLDADAAPVEGGGGAPAAAPAGPDDLAYVIYTSGSTGQPKGVEITHRNLVHSTLARRAVYGDRPASYLLLSSFSFDSSVAGIFWTLCEGGALVLPAEGTERDLHELRRLVAEHGVTHTLALPSLYALLLRETRGEGLRSLRCVIVAGESCPRDLIELHEEMLAEAALFNEYGPTEATVWSTVHRCRRDDPQRVPIGRPIPGARIRVLDELREPVPIGTAGELYVGGPGVARGYLRRPELTAAKFVDDPFEPGARLYRTGDLARWRADGSLDFLGRVDHQVKIRGYRIELEEIEEVLRRDPSVAEAAVVARGPVGEQQLAAWVVAKPGAEVSTDDLAARVTAALPAHMVPSSFAALPELPKMPNGKVDRKALAQREDGGAAGEPYVAPRNPTEAALAEIWQAVLKRERIGVHDSFFRLGGHSLLVTQLIFRLREALGVELSLRAVFDHPTVAALAAEIARGGDAPGRPR